MEFKFGKFGNTTEGKNETVENAAESAAMADDLEVVELGADDSAVQSARAAVEAMKNNSFFAQGTEGSSLPPTAPVFPATVAVGENAQEEGKAAAQPTGEEAVSEPEEVAAVEAAQPAPVEEEDPMWKVNMDALDTELAGKTADVESILTEQINTMQNAVKKQLQAMQDAMRNQLQLAEDTVKETIKEAGSSTEQIVAVEKLKLTKAFDLEKQTMNANFEKKMQELQESHDAEIRDLKEANNQEITQMKDDQINALDKMKQMYGDQMEEMQTAYREKNAALKREMDQYKEKLDILMLEHEADPFMGGVDAAAAPTATE